MRVTYWWTLRMGDKKKPLPAEVIDEINVAIRGLLHSVEEGHVYEELQSLGTYIQWTIDEAQYQKNLSIHEDELRER
ncbi:hypothetical protein M758_UG339400, partial [Ceratodon purpureus]